MYNLILYFIIGFIQDIIGIFDFKATQNGYAMRSSVITFVNEMTGWVVFFFIITSPGVVDNPQKALMEILFYALGGSIGNYVAIEMHNKQKILK